MTRQSASLMLAMVVAILCEGCAWIVAPDTQREWADRLAAAETTIMANRGRLDIIGTAGHRNCLNFIEEIDALDGADDGKVKAYNIEQVERWNADQRESLSAIRDAEQDLALLRDEIEEGGF